MNSFGITALVCVLMVITLAEGKKSRHERDPHGPLLPVKVLIPDCLPFGEAVMSTIDELVDSGVLSPRNCENDVE
ncbi:hypothetical protein NPIL_23941, partial [Nephila pilipes]